MNNSIKEVLDFIEDNDVKFVKLAFCDAFGKLRNVSLLASELKMAFEKGVSIDANAVDGMEYEQTEVKLYPDPSTIQVLPWRPQHGSVIRFFCNIKHNDGTFAESDGRYLLSKAQDNLARIGYNCSIGSDVEFYLFNLDDNGHPTHTPYDNAGYLDTAPRDKGENVRREICFTLEKIGLQPISSHHEKGPGQNEIKFKYNDALMAADDLLTFKSTVKSIAANNGLYASFLPKPIANAEGSALKINFSLEKDGLDAFIKDENAESFIAGILNRAEELTLFLNPTINSYDRFKTDSCPKYLGWAKNKFQQIIRVSSSNATVMHFNSADPSCNPYVAYALLLSAGAEGIVNKMKLPEPPAMSIEKMENSQYKKLPSNLKEAINLAKNSEFVKSIIPETHFDHFIELKEKEWKEYCESKDKHAFIEDKYFDSI